MSRSVTTRWVVTAPHLQPRAAAERAPWGTHHVRREGSARTACGLPTATWFTFWGRRFEPRVEGACPDCGFALVVGADLAPRTSLA